MMIKIAPSVLTADFNNLSTEIKSISKADYIHIDIMDGHFVPNISFGPHITKAISKITEVPLDIHLMVTNPLEWINRFYVDSVEFMTIHIESNEPLETIKYIKNKGIKAGITLKPGTNLDLIKPFLPLVDLVLVMSVEPGFGGQGFIYESVDRIKELSDLRQSNDYRYVIEVDGGVNDKTAKLCREAGADVLVVGSYLFNQEDRNKTIEALK